MTMPRLLSFLFVLVPCLASASTADVPLHPFHAEYRTLRDGDAVGITMLVLATAADGTWTLTSETRGTNGLARLAGIHVVETSHFRWIDGHLQALDYDYRQDSAFKSRRRHADFDWATSTASVTEGHESHRYPVPGNVIDRQSVTLALALALARGASDLSFPVAVKDRVETVDYRRAGEEPVTVPAGTLPRGRGDPRRGSGRQPQARVRSLVRAVAALVAGADPAEQRQGRRRDTGTRGNSARGLNAPPQPGRRRICAPRPPSFSSMFS
ncbi:MAG: DUF3108 domain-containing protein [Lysobacterales bacterium]